MSDNQNRLVDVILEIKQDIGELKGAVKHMDQTFERHTESDHKSQEAVIERLDKYNAHLEEHMKRTSLLEQAVSDMKPFISFSGWVATSLKVVAAFGIIITLYKFFGG